MNAGAIIVMQQRRAVERFRANRCVNPEAARPLEELGVRRSFATNRLIRRRILCEVAFERYWLDESLWRELERRRRIAVLILVTVGIVVLGLMLLYNR